MKRKNEKILEKIERGVTDVAPYDDLADYEMVDYSSEDTVNSQGS